MLNIIEEGFEIFIIDYSFFIIQVKHETRHYMRWIDISVYFSLVAENKWENDWG